MLVLLELCQNEFVKPIGLGARDTLRLEMGYPLYGHDLNEETSQMLDKQNYPLDKYGSYGIINMDATWMPNFLIGEALKDKQRKYPNTKFIKDFKKVFVKDWQLKDDSNAMMVFNRKGERVFYVDGKLTKKQSDEMVALIWKLIKQ